ncbi:DUF3189 family protein [Inediibacterium massiliense]|uniref:DUF3189 family protein n=1 Tax=Inediibacterium massiliense TaxID=1658111 RepID=UPI002E8E3CE6|nr:DUF3189 family protein [Inediibacterium massiliense]
MIIHIIYHCVGGCHSSCTAAAIHLNMLPLDHIPKEYDLLNVPFFDALEKTDAGKIIYRGTDEWGNSIYTLGRQFVPHIVLSSILDTWKILAPSSEKLLLVNTIPCVNTLMRIGGFSSRRLHWVRFGRPIVAKGTIQAYKNIMKVVEETKKIIH